MKIMISMIAGATCALAAALGCYGAESAPGGALPEEAGEARSDLWIAKPAARAAEVPFDIERQVVLIDTDGDTFPDITEAIEGTDPGDATDLPGGAPVVAPSFPAASCRAGFKQAGNRLCISSATQNATRYRSASNNCRDQMGHVCTYEDLYYLYVKTALDATYDPSGVWIGNIVGDDEVLCGNKSVTSNNDPDILNFEGVCDKDDLRPYWCCHDDDG